MLGRRQVVRHLMIVPATWTIENAKPTEPGSFNQLRWKLLGEGDKMLHVGQVLYDNDPRYRGRTVEVNRVEERCLVCKCGPRESHHSARSGPQRRGTTSVWIFDRATDGHSRERKGQPGRPSMTAFANNWAGNRASGA
jgi:hypothetical protein